MSASEPTAESELRLASARRKVRSFLAQVSALEGSDFAQPDALEALAEVKARFKQYADTLAALRPDAPSVDARRGEVVLAAQELTTVLGILLRSSNVRNPFEVFYPLRALLRSVVPNAKLIISSEWDWSPFATYGQFPDFAFIGTPATEADNVLIVPLAGHEIGHVAWDHHLVWDQFSGNVDSMIEAHVSAMGLQGEERQDFKSDCVQYTGSQLLEVFCDFVGLYLFKESYLYAYEHILAPGGGARGFDYPDAKSRVNYLEGAAKSWSIDYEPALFSGWQASTGPLPQHLTIADQIVAALAPALQTAVKNLLHAQNVASPRRAVVNSIAKSASDRVPYGEPAYLSEVLCAGWSVLRTEGGLGRGGEKDSCTCLNEVLLKTVEVSEFLRRRAHA